MPSTDTEIPVLPCVVVLSVVVSAVLLWWLHRHAALSVPRVLVAAVLAVYVAGVVGNTLLPVYLGRSGSGLHWWEYPDLTPLVGYEVSDMVQNVVLFVPLGVLVPLVARITSVPRVVFTGFLVSLTMELLQWVNAVVAHGGHVPDVNDLLSNTLGVPLGYGAYRLALRLPVLGDRLRAAAWPERSSRPVSRSGA